MKPSEICKKAGLKGLVEVVKFTGKGEQTLIRWARENPQLFDIVVEGTVIIKKRREKNIE